MAPVVYRNIMGLIKWIENTCIIRENRSLHWRSYTSSSVVYKNFHVDRYLLSSCMLAHVLDCITYTLDASPFPMSMT